MDCLYIDSILDNRHLWTEEEELALFQEAETLLKTQKYSKQSARNACLMARMNERFPGVAVKFTVGVIKNKLSLFKQRWLGRHTLVFAPLLILSLPHS